MIRKGLSIFVIILCLGVILSGCTQKTVVKEDPSAKGTELSQAGKDAKEAERIREEEAKKEFEKSLVAKKTPELKGPFLKAECSRISISILTNITSSLERQRL